MRRGATAVTILVALSSVHSTAVQAPALTAVSAACDNRDSSNIIQRQFSKCRRFREQLTPDNLYAGAAGAVGAAIGWSTAERVTDPLSGRVSTAEAWRRKVKAKRPVPLLALSPRMLAAALTSYSMAEYALAFPEHGPVDSLQRVWVWRVGCANWMRTRDFASSVGAKLEDLASKTANLAREAARKATPK